MNSLMRRTFIKKLLITPLAIGLLPQNSYALSNLGNKGLYSASALDHEMHKAYISWSKSFNQAPAEFLYRLNEITMSDNSISSISVEEFRNGNTIEFNGIILGKTESAIILDSYFN